MGKKYRIVKERNPYYGIKCYFAEEHKFLSGWLFVSGTYSTSQRETEYRLKEIIRGDNIVRVIEVR